MHIASPVFVASFKIPSRAAGARILRLGTKAFEEPLEVNVDYLPLLTEVVTQLLARPATHRAVDTLKKKLQHTSEPFVWSTIELKTVAAPLPKRIKSCWIFVLKKDVPSGCHYHPNSIQHMVMIEGKGTSRIGKVSGQLHRLDEPGCSLEEIWSVIPEGVSHEFFPTGRDMVVLSFHTCEAEELEEISCDSGAVRNYQLTWL